MDSNNEKLQSCLAQFRQMPEACILIDYRSRENRLTFDDRMAVTRCIEQAFAPLFLEMRAESPSLSESDLIFCALTAAGFKPEVISDCISISKESLRMRRKRIKEKLTPTRASQLFPDTDGTVTKTVTGRCCDNDTQQISGAQDPALLLRQNQSNAKAMEKSRITFGQAIKSGLRNTFKFTGRASRQEFWYYILFYHMVFYPLSYVICFFIPIIMVRRQIPIAPTTPFYVVFIMALILITPLAGITVRRLHDSERNGAWVLSYLMPMILGLITATVTISHLDFGPKVKSNTETTTYINPEEYYNKYTDSNGDTIKIYPDYMEQVNSGKRFMYYKANGDSICVEPGVFKPMNEATVKSSVDREQKFINGAIGVLGFLALLSTVGFFILIIMCAMPGTEGPNAYGQEPKGTVPFGSFDSPSYLCKNA